MWKFFLILLISLSATRAEESVNPCDILTGNQTFAPNPRGCGMYFYCGDNTPTSGRCPSQFYFSFETQSCELPEDVECTIDEKLWDATCPGIGVAKIPHEYSCSEYSVCLDNEQIDRKCPGNLHFSPYDQDCVDPFDANCPNDAITCKGSDPFVPLFIPNSRNCRAYYMCFNNNLHSFICAPNQVFDRKTNMCVPSGTVDCEQTLNPDLEVPETLTYDCSKAKNGSRNPHPEHCKFWFWCINGRSQLFWCGKDALFDSVTRLCAEQNQTVCGNIRRTGGLQLHDLSNEIELKVMPATEIKAPVSVPQPRLSVLRSAKIAAGVQNSKIADVHVDTKQEKFYGLF